MTMTAVPVTEAIDEAVDFVRGAWREAWAPMLLVSAGWMSLVVGAHAEITSQAAEWCQRIGWALQLFNWPLMGALYRQGLGGRAHRGLGPGGLQLGGVEWRMLAVNIVLGAVCLLAGVPVLVLSGLFYFVFHRMGGVTLGPAGHWAWWFLFSIPFWVGLIVGLIYVCARLSLAMALSVDRRRIRPFRGWPLTEGHARSIGGSFILSKVPTAAVVLGLAAFGWIESSDVPIGLHGSWPLPDALGAGAVAGLMLSVLQAPLSVGVLTFFYDVLAPVEGSRISSSEPESRSASSDESLLMEEPSAVAELPDPPFSTVEYFPHTGRFSRIAAAWFAHDPVPDLYAHLVEPERAPVDDPLLEPETAEPYPHSVVEYSPHTGRFSRLFSPWLAHDEAPLDQEVEHQPVDGLSPRTPDLDGRPPAALDGAGEGEHAES